MGIKKFIDRFMGQKIAFIGAGVSHAEAITVFAKNGANVLVLDKNEIDISLKEVFRKLGVECRIGANYLEKIDAEVYFRSPGIAFNSEFINGIRNAEKVVTSELELFFELCAGAIIGVTGSEGKTTTATLIYEILKQAQVKVHIGGNMGLPLLARVEEIEENDWVVAELSSFQLESMRRSPDVAVVTNISENHLNVHKTMANYIAAKKNLILHQNGFSKAVLNAKCKYAKEFEAEVRGKLSWFDVETLGVFENALWANSEKILEIEEIKLRGWHNVQNIMAAIAATEGLATKEDVRNAVCKFKGVEHRLEFCGKINMADCFNDSIATTPQRTIAGLKSFTKPIVLIAGGSDKGLSFNELGELIAKRVKCLIVVGETAFRIKEAVLQAAKNHVPVIKEAADLVSAVEIAAKQLEPGDVLLFSPASASFDKYKNFEKRGKHFKLIVAEKEQGFL
ncbi:MAG: UDP-N-acetylmuramoyl-L-alanine--D-glutamate ligase [Oscillospiraceae bacterium]|nr:UDP-N-acetylmuramoyl-L-alanine--D-glutamate ligase [Oscillospiraceae bacterium]